MKIQWQKRVLAGAGFCLCAILACAQDDPSDGAGSEDPVQDRDGRSWVTPVTDDTGSVDVNRPERPDSGIAWTDLTRDRIREFEIIRERYLAEQQELLRRWRSATDADREKIRELIRERRAEWIEQAKAVREQARERLRELLTELPRHREALEAARERAREQLQDAKDAARERRGVD